MTFQEIYDCDTTAAGRQERQRVAASRSSDRRKAAERDCLCNSQAVQSDFDAFPGTLSTEIIASSLTMSVGINDMIIYFGNVVHLQ